MMKDVIYNAYLKAIREIFLSIKLNETTVNCTINEVIGSILYLLRNENYKYVDDLSVLIDAALHDSIDCNEDVFYEIVTDTLNEIDTYIKILNN